MAAVVKILAMIARSDAGPRAAGSCCCWRRHAARGRGRRRGGEKKKRKGITPFRVWGVGCCRRVALTVTCGPLPRFNPEASFIRQRKPSGTNNIIAHDNHQLTT